MTIIQMPIPLALNATLKEDEKIICTNATVIEDSGGNISWINNDKMMPILTGDEA